MRSMHVRVDCPPVPEALEALAEGVVLLNCWYLRDMIANGIDPKPLYESGVVYRREPAGREWWECVSDVLGVAAGKSGDCEDLANWRSAELRVLFGDEGAHTRVVRTPRGSFHAIVQHGDGTLEDPSRICLRLEKERKGQ